MKCIEGTWFGFALDGQTVAATSFGESQDKVFWSLQEIIRSKPTIVVDTESALAQETFAALKAAYDGKALNQVPLAMHHLPPYTQKVLKAVSQIPVGYVASYGGVAAAVGGGARAVGNAMANNPFAPIVPCHRVVTSSLGLGGYGGGLQVKFEFLRREQKGYTEPKEVATSGNTLKVFPVEWVLKKLKKPATLCR
jgi:methylated-DNA-[protein]-cysteine S-methyltransferase